MQQCEWPKTCFDWASNGDQLCTYHKKVVDGLITGTIPDPLDEGPGSGRRKKKKRGTDRTSVPGVSGADVDPTALEHGVPSAS